MSGELRCNPLHNTLMAPLGIKDAHIRMTVGIDDAGHHHAAGGVDNLAAGLRNLADLGNPASRHRNVSRIGRHSGAVDNLRVFNQYVHSKASLHVLIHSS